MERCYIDAFSRISSFSPELAPHLKIPLMILLCVLYSDPAQKGETPPESIM